MPIKAIVAVFLLGLGTGVYCTSKFSAPVETIKDRIVTVVHTVVRPDGTRTIDEVKHETVEAVVPKVGAKPDWALGLTYNSRLETGVTLDRRLLGDFWLTSGATRTQVQVGIRYEF